MHKNIIRAAYPNDALVCKRRNGVLVRGFSVRTCFWNDSTLPPALVVQSNSIDPELGLSHRVATVKCSHRSHFEKQHRCSPFTVLPEVFVILFAQDWNLFPRRALVCVSYICMASICVAFGACFDPDIQWQESFGIVHSARAGCLNYPRRVHPRLGIGLRLEVVFPGQQKKRSVCRACACT